MYSLKAVQISDTYAGAFIAVMDGSTASDAIRTLETRPPLPPALTQAAPPPPPVDVAALRGVLMGEGDASPAVSALTSRLLAAVSAAGSLVPLRGPPQLPQSQCVPRVRSALVAALARCGITRFEEDAPPDVNAPPQQSPALRALSFGVQFAAPALPPCGVHVLWGASSPEMGGPVVSIRGFPVGVAPCPQAAEAAFAEFIGRCNFGLRCVLSNVCV